MGLFASGITANVSHDDESHIIVNTDAQRYEGILNDMGEISWDFGEFWARVATVAQGEIQLRILIILVKNITNIIIRINLLMIQFSSI